MRFWILGAAVALAACGETAPPVRSAGHVPVPVYTPIQPSPPVNISAIAGLNAARLIAQFGNPQLDMNEGSARKLQFAGPICVLDAYLYPQGRSEPIVTYIDTRQRNGGPIDQASCVAALVKRR
jgi:hypothetical protein